MKNDTLTTEQQQALNLDEGVIVAGAGAGKTRTLIAKIIHDQETGMRPSDQVVVTFTNAAANEMAVRLEESGGRPVRHLGTLHSLAFRSVAAAWGGTLTVIDDKTFDSLIRSTCKRTRINAPVSAVRGWILDRPKAGNGKLLVVAILSAMKSERLIHPDVMLAAYVELLKLDAPVGLTVYVDETQDGSAVDFGIYASLTKSGKLILFGDPRQAIYAFRGGDPALFIEAIRAFGRKVVELTANFRSAKRVIDLANKIAGGMGLDLPPMVQGGDPFTGIARSRGIHSSTETEVLDLIALIKDQVENMDSVAVLTRYNAVADQAAAILRSEGVRVEQPGREVIQNAAIISLKTATVIPDDWKRAMSMHGVSFELQDRLLPALESLTDAGLIAATIDEVLQTPSDFTKVWVSTIHGAKGLEWHDVHLIGADDLSFDPADPEDVRLAYVAVTRAKIFFTWSAARDRIAQRRVDGLQLSPVFPPCHPPSNDQPIA